MRSGAEIAAGEAPGCSLHARRLPPQRHAREWHSVTRRLFFSQFAPLTVRGCRFTIPCRAQGDPFSRSCAAGAPSLADAALPEPPDGLHPLRPVYTRARSSSSTPSRSSFAPASSAGGASLPSSRIRITARRSSLTSGPTSPVRLSRRQHDARRVHGRRDARRRTLSTSQSGACSATSPVSPPALRASAHTARWRMCSGAKETSRLRSRSRRSGTKPVRATPSTSCTRT